MIVRPYDRGDASATRDVFVRAIRDTANKDYSQEQLGAWAGAADSLTVWASRRESARTFVALSVATGALHASEPADRVIGFTDVDSAGYIDMMYVDPEFARRGVASELLRTALAVAAASGAGELTTHASRTALPFFLARGFSVVEERQVVARGVRMTNFLMRRKLGSTSTSTSTSGV